MLKKLLKYDLKAIFKFWWLAAAFSVVMSVIGGLSISILASENERIPEIVEFTSGLTVFFTVFSFAIVPMVTFVLLFARVYKNFYTDEGYLTFTLPVTRGQLINSKLISGIIVDFTSGAIIVFDILLMLCIGLAKYIFTKDFLTDFIDIITETVDFLGVFTFVYLIEAFLITFLGTVFSILFLYNCITLGSIITKKLKLLLSIGVYYFANSIFSTIIQIFYMFGIQSIAEKLISLSSGEIMLVVALLALVIILFLSIFCGILYTLQYWMLDRKLNLS